MVQYNIMGMSCAACSARVEKAVSSVAGVKECSVNLLTNSMGVEGTASADDVISAVEKAGYGAALKEPDGSDTADDNHETKDSETPKLIKRLVSSCIFLLLLMYITMGHMMLDWPLPEWLAGNHLAMGLAEMILTAAIVFINQRFFISGFNAAIHLAPNMDTLVAMGASAAFGWSIYVLFLMTDNKVISDPDAGKELMMQLYFESAAMILTLITVGKTLEARAKGKTTNALKSLMDLAPKTATIIKDGVEQVVSVKKVALGDIYVVRPGDSFPVDGVVLDGSGAVDESALTGESVPIDKEKGDSVSAGTINRSGFLKCRAVRVGEDTTLSQIVRMVEDASATKAPIAKIADKVSGVFVPVVICISVITVAVWLMLGSTFGYALARGISVLVISCPCALGLATPVAIMVGSGVGAKNGVLFKTAAALEHTGRIDIVALDKTGTITSGSSKVTDIITSDGTSEAQLLRIAAAAEKPSEHPIAEAIVSYAKSIGISIPEVTEFTARPGNGLTAKLNDDEIAAGNLKFIGERAYISEEMSKKAEALSTMGKTPVYFILEGKLAGIISVADSIRPDSNAAISELKNMGIKVVMLTGDNEKTAAAIGKQAGVDNVIAGIMPDEKEKAVLELSGQGKVCMVGDGINDAPALTRADIGMAIGAGTDVAIDAADVVLVKSRLEDVPMAISLGRSTLKNIHENLFWAFFYNIIGIPVAAGLLIPFGITLNPMIGAAAMSLSSFCVVMNALRLNLFKPKRVIKINEKKGENKSMSDIIETTIDIEGMMCAHCEAHVRDVLSAVPGVRVISVSHDSKSAKIERTSDVTDEKIEDAVKLSGYEFKGLH